MTIIQKNNINNILSDLGRCIELISIDPNFNNISIGLYEKNGIYTVWSFSKVTGIKERIEEVRNQLINLGGMESISGTYNKAKYPNNQVFERPMKFLIKQAVEKPANYRHSTGPIKIKDLRSPLEITITPKQANSSNIYEVSASLPATEKNSGDSVSGVHTKPEIRINAIIRGLIKYGNMERVDNTSVKFSNGEKLDNLVRLILPYARNITGTQDMLDADSIKGQMTTNTLGFANQE
ncbi:MAG: hypothetical protein CL766_02365 [Chloroflexi bacterium]|nr:hypothetical protein [Chloroflexota bacterium]MCH2304074.1 hypothetical protein [SAR202 cluster bacterium]|tara:strand:- start:29622 stop:30332 length:711 start_codon:yes stop_codon:yes gene_type:complete